MARPSGFYKTVSVLRSFPAATADGATSLVLETKEEGTIAFVVTHKTLPILRKALNDLDLMLSQHTGNA